MFEIENKTVEDLYGLSIRLLSEQAASLETGFNTIRNHSGGEWKPGEYAQPDIWETKLHQAQMLAGCIVTILNSIDTVWNKVETINKPEVYRHYFLEAWEE